MIMSKGNRKLGKRKIANVSLTPIESCAGCFEHCGKTCYSLKAYRMYKETREAWDHNLAQATHDPQAYFKEIHLALNKYTKDFFRWHVAGDIINPRYFKGMIQVARDFPEIKFLVFTKQYQIVNHSRMKIPGNLTIVFSAWPGMPIVNPKGYPVAFMQDGNETRVTPGAIECPGLCEDCGACWSLPSLKKDVVFHKH